MTGINLKINATTKDEADMHCIDQYWKHLQKIDKWYFLIPPTIIQIGDYSDIEQMYVDYSKSLLVYNKT